MAMGEKKRGAQSEIDSLGMTNPGHVILKERSD